MPVDRDKIAQLERELAEARSQLLQEDGERYRIIMREISDAEKQRILDSLTDRQERILFGLELPEEPKQRGRPRTGTSRPTKSEGDKICPVCGKTGLTDRGLKLHLVRVHKEQSGDAGEATADTA